MKYLNINKYNIDSFVDLLSNNIMVYENIEADKIFLNFNNGNVIVKNLQSVINLDSIENRTYYKDLVYFIENIDIRIKTIIPNNIWIVCEYLNEYSEYTAKHNMILTGIMKNNEYIQSVEQITEYADALDISPLPVLFYGKLASKQLEYIRNFLNTSKEDLKHIFGDENFATFFYSLLNPSYKNSLLKTDTLNLDKIIINIESDNILLSILNPFYEKQDNDTNYTEIYSLLICDFLSFLNTIDIERRLISGYNTDIETIYVDFISDLFNEYIEQRYDRISNFDFDIPSIKNDDFNIEFIDNIDTSKLVKSDIKYEYMFKNILSAFRNYKNEPVGLIDGNILKVFNKYVDTFNKVIKRAVRIQSEEDLSNLFDLSMLFNIDYPIPDADKKHYINKTEAEPLVSSDKNKGKTKKFSK